MTSLDYKDAGVSVLFDLEPTQAIEFFRAKGLKPTFSYLDMLQGEHDTAFTVAKMMDLDLLATVAQQTDSAIAQGWSKDRFRKELTPILQAAGWWGRRDAVDPLTGQTVQAQLGSAHRLNTIYRTNVRNAYATGHWQQIDRQRKAFPWLVYDAVDDHRTREEHAALDNITLPVGHPFWTTHYPPNGWNCRCTVIQITDAQRQNLGIEPSKTPKIDERQWTNPRTGETRMVPADLDPGWDHNPGQARAARLQEIADEKLGTIEGLFGAQAAQAAGRAMAQSQAAAQQAAARVAAQEAAATQAAAQAQIDAALDAGTPYLAPALKKLQGQKTTADLTPSELLAKATEAAEKSKASAFLADYKAAVIAGKTPSAKAQAAFESLPGPEATKIATQIAAAAEKKAAAAALGEIEAGNVTKQKQAILAKLQASGEADSLSPVALLEKVDDLAAQAQAKANAAANVSAYKANLIKGKQPTDTQAAAFQALPESKQQQLLDAVDAAQVEQMAQQKLDAAIAHAQEQQEHGDPFSVEAATLSKWSEIVDPSASAAQKWAQWQKTQLDIDAGAAAQKQAAIDQAAAEGAAAAAKAPAPKPPKDTPGTPAIAGPGPNLVQTGPQKGTNPGGFFRDRDTGITWYIKRPQTAAHAKNEILAAKLYEAAGVEVPQIEATTFEGAPAVASRIIDGVGEAPNAKTADWSQYQGAHDGFVVDAWLANWDVVGETFDNLLVKGQKAVRVDTGGALLFRAQGAPKAAASGAQVTELDTLRDPSTNWQAARVFGNVSDEALATGRARLQKIDDATITQLVKQHGPGFSDVERAELAAKLIERRDDLINQLALAKTPPGPGVSAADLDHSIAVARDAAAADLETLDQKMLDAIKGVSGQAAKGEAVRPVDVKRIFGAEAAYQQLLAKHAPHIKPSTLDALRGHYDGWLTTLKVNTGDGTVGAPAKTIKGHYKPLGVAINIDPDRVPIVRKGEGLTTAEAKAIFKEWIGAENAYALDPSEIPPEFAHLDAPLIQAIRGYTASKFKDLNAALRKAAKSGQHTDFWTRVKKLVNEALEQSTKYQGKSTRGVDFNPRTLDEQLAMATRSLEGDGFYVDAGFLSSTKGNRPAFPGNVWFHVQGRNGVFVDPISANAGVEQEVLFKAGTRFRVTNIEREGTRYHIYMNEVVE